MGMTRLGRSGLLSFAAGAATLMGAVPAFADDVLKDGQPTDKAMGFQPAVTDLGHKVTSFYNDLLFPIIVAICLLVLGLLIWIIIRYNRKANPNAARFSHNTLIEIIWTVVPVIILVVIACVSLPLLKQFNDMPTPDVVVKVTGNQWFWTYDYPELGVSDVESRLLPDAQNIKTAEAKGIPYLLETDNKLIVPVNRVIHIQTTGADVIHSFTVPAFRIKMDAVPGRLNNTWFKATKTGTYYGQCSELCGKDHAYMPIEVKVVSDAEFDAYIIKQGGKTRAMLAAEAASAAQASAAAEASAAAQASASATQSSAASVEASTAAGPSVQKGAPAKAPEMSSPARSGAAASPMQ